MSMSVVMAIAALACAVLLLIQLKSRLWPVAAAVVSGAQLLIAFGILRLDIAGLPLSLILGVALAVAGIALWWKVSGKTHVSAATVIAVIGLLQVVGGFLAR